MCCDMHTAYRASVTANYISGNEKKKERERGRSETEEM